MAAPFKFNAQVDRDSRAWFAKKLQEAYGASPGQWASWHELIQFLNSRLGVKTPPEPLNPPERSQLTPDLLGKVRSGELTAAQVSRMTGITYSTVLNWSRPDDVRAVWASARRQARNATRLAGLCVDCSTPVSPGRTRCPEHLESANLSGKRHRLIRPPPVDPSHVTRP